MNRSLSGHDRRHRASAVLVAAMVAVLASVVPAHAAPKGPQGPPPHAMERLVEVAPHVFGGTEDAGEFTTFQWSWIR